MKMQLKPKRAAVVASISLALFAASALAAENHDHAADNAGNAAQTPKQSNTAGGMMDDTMQGGSMMTGHGTGGDMSSMMKNMHTMMHGNTAEGMMGGGMSGGMMGEGNPLYDSDGDGTTSVEELRDALQSELTDFDKDDNGVLTIDEFETLNATRQRNQMVDRFQALDEDGDGQVTKDEMSAPADKMQRRMDHRARSAEMQGLQGMQGDGMKAPAVDKE